MLDWILVAAAFLPLLAMNRRAQRKALRHRMAEEAQGFMSAMLAPMDALQPPKAANDDVLAPVFDEVERELRRVGYLR